MTIITFAQTAINPSNLVCIVVCGVMTINYAYYANKDKSSLKFFNNLEQSRQGGLV